MSAPRLDDAEEPPPSAQQERPWHQQHVIAGDGRSSLSTPASAADRRHVSNKPAVARRAACTRTRTSTSTSTSTSTNTRTRTRTRNPATDGSDHLHNDHIPLVSNMKPRPASSTAAKPTARSTAPVNPPRTLPSGVAASPRIFFDPWNSSSTGHQRAENRLSGSTSWRQSRSLKLTEQYKGGLAGGKRVADTVGAGSHDFGTDGRKPNGDWEKGAKSLRPGGQKSLAELWGKSKAAVTSKAPAPEGEPALPHVLKVAIPEDTDEAATADQAQPAPQHLTRPPEKHIFQGLCFYINGSTMPLISDHKLKYLLTQHGASHSITLGRRTVTHVILGANCGGGLAGSKLHKEITKSRGNAVKYITVEWVLESIKAGKRLPESRFSPVRLAVERQSSVLSFGTGAHRPAVQNSPTVQISPAD